MLRERVTNHKFWARYRWLLLSLAALLAALCAARRSAAVTVHLDEHDATSTVVLHSGDRLRVELPASPASGYRWKAKLLDASHLEMISKDLRPDNTRLTASGTQVFVWKAISPGHAEIHLVYDRPEERSETPGINHPDRKENQISVNILADELLPPGPGIDSSVVLKGRYKGTLFCATCRGIVVELSLFASDPETTANTVFAEKWTYQSSNAADQVHAATGRWTVVHGTYADPSATVYVLASPIAGQENFALAGDHLVQLDDQMLPVRGQDGKEILLEASPR